MSARAVIKSYIISRLSSFQQVNSDGHHLPNWRHFMGVAQKNGRFGRGRKGKLHSGSLHIH